MKWWAQFDTSKAEAAEVKKWFQENPKFLKAVDPETSLSLNQKSKLASFLAGAQSKEHLTKNLKEVLRLLQVEEQAKSSSKVFEEAFEEDNFYQNEDDCFGINLNED